MDNCNCNAAGAVVVVDNHIVGVAALALEDIGRFVVQLEVGLEVVHDMLDNCNNCYNNRNFLVSLQLVAVAFVVVEVAVAAVVVVEAEEGIAAVGVDAELA